MDMDIDIEEDPPGVFTAVYRIAREDFPYDVDAVVLKYDQGKDAVTIENVRVDKIRRAVAESYQALKQKGMGYRQYFELVCSQIESVLAGKPVECMGPADGLRDQSDGAGRADQSDLADFTAPPIDVLSPCVQMPVTSINVRMLKATGVRFSLACKRCGARMEREIVGSPGLGGAMQSHQLIRDSTNVLSCEKCKGVIKIESLFYLMLLSPGVAENRDRLCKLVCRGADGICIAEVRFAFTCAECGQPHVAKGPLFDAHCRSCHSPLYVRAKEARIAAHHFADSKQAKRPAADAGASAEYLKTQGTCKHYRKSRRIFVFPCCSGRFPCDICHDASEAHKAAEAKRMVCGLCGHEESVKKECSKCRTDLTKEHSKFWEGGRGSRDKATMSRKDKRKYKK